MGGFGSGRHGGRSTAEATASYVLTTRVLTQARLRVGQVGRGTLRYGEEEFPLEIAIDLSDSKNPFLELTHETRDYREGDRVELYRVRLAWTMPTYGGRRWWFECPITRRVVAKLYLPNGGHRFWSRRAYRLGYACQRETRHDRLLRKARKLSYALGGDGDPEVPPSKPKWMRWKTYDRKIGAWQAAAERADEAFDLHLVPLVQRLLRHGAK
jgi:hypothetical protein